MDSRSMTAGWLAAMAAMSLSEEGTYEAVRKLVQRAHDIGAMEQLEVCDDHLTEVTSELRTLATAVKQVRSVSGIGLSSMSHAEQEAWDQVDTALVFASERLEAKKPVDSAPAE